MWRRCSGWHRRGGSGAVAFEVGTFDAEGSIVVADGAASVAGGVADEAGVVEGSNGAESQLDGPALGASSGFGVGEGNVSESQVRAGDRGRLKKRNSLSVLSSRVMVALRPLMVMGLVIWGSAAWPGPAIGSV